jgi:lysophospholipase L1-like esterase
LPQYLLAATALLLSLLVIEAGFRVKAYLDDRELDAFENLSGAALVADATTKVRTRHLVRLNPNPRIIYELIPGLVATYKGAIVHINSDGFRGPLIESAKPPRTVRIAGLGDSVMFGWSVGEDESFLAVLAKRLTERYPETAWEWINSAVPGYNTVMEVETLKERLLPYGPDLVIIDFVKNDLSLPNFIRNRAAYFNLRKSYLWQFIRTVKQGLERGPDDRLLPRPDNTVPPEYRDLVGIESYRAAMTELKNLSRKNGFRTLVFSHEELPPDVRQVCEELGLPHVNGMEARRRYMREHGIQQYMGSPLTRNARDPHPSAIAHQLLADVLYEHLERSGWLAELSLAAGDGRRARLP